MHALRIKHWLKNGLVFLPLIFSGKITDLGLDALALAAFLGFSMMASSIYLLNDIKDVEADRNHPTKRNRPIASGEVSLPIAIAIMIVFACGSIALNAVSLNPVASIISILAYGLLNVLYSCGLKHVPIVDTTILSFGFLLRVLYGGFFCNIPVSPWLCLCILSLAYFFALGKRRGEIRCCGTNSRASLESCPIDFFDKCMYVFMASGLVFYSMWLFDRLSGVNDQIFPVVLAVCVMVAIFACLRYSFIIESDTSDGDPIEVVTSDKILLGSIIVWLIVMLALLYLIL